MEAPITSHDLHLHGAAGVKASARRTIAGTLRRNRPRLVAASLLIMGHQACEALVPVAIGLSIDTAIGAGNPWFLAVALAGLAALFTTLTLCWRWAARHGYGAAMDEAHVLRSSLANRFVRGHAGRARGELLSVATSDADLGSQAITYVSGLWGAAAALGVSCLVLLGIDLRLGLLLMAVSVAVALAMNIFSPWLARRSTLQQETLAATGALAADLLTGLRVLHGLGARHQAALRYNKVSQEAVRAGTAAGNARAVALGATSLAGTAVMAVSVVGAGLLALDGDISIGAFVAAVGAAQFIAEPLGNVGHYLQMRAATRAGAGRIGAFDGVTVHEATAVAAPAGAAPRLWVGAAGQTILAVRAGEYVGVVADGPSTELLLAALDPGAGSRHGGVPETGVPWEATADDVGLAGIDAAQRRALLHLEPRRPDLFAGTVMENLALAPQVPQANADAALRAAQAHDFVDALPGGTGGRIRERGSSLSGGQRQRLALARALHTNPPVLVLDHPTSAVDSVTEDAVAAGIRHLRHPDTAVRSTVILTSSPALLAGADRVVLLRRGELVATGTHTELLDSHESYRDEVLR